LQVEAARQRIVNQIAQPARRNLYKRYALQCGMAGVVVLILLLVLDAVTQTVLIAALGASAFIAFAVPRSLHSDPRCLIGGYLIGMISGVTMSLVHSLFFMSGTTLSHAVMIICGALAISFTMFLMVITRTEHPPAAALALGLVLNQWDPLTLGVVLIGVIALSLVKQLVLPLLMDLI
jgi:CBS-domain-containing membrane protein